MTALVQGACSGQDSRWIAAGSLPAVIYSHPHKQGNIYHWPLAAQEAGLETKFLTGLYYKPDRFPYSLLARLPQPLRRRLARQLEKRRMPGLDPETVVPVSGPWPELAVRMAALLAGRKALPDSLSRLLNRAHDLCASIRISRQAADQPTVLHCFQGSSNRTLGVARRRGLRSILEITLPPSVHRILARERERLGMAPGRKEPWPEDLGEIRQADYLVAQSRFTVDYLVHELGIEPGRVILRPFGVDTELFHPPAPRRDGRPFRALLVGQLVIRKGLHLLLEGWKQLKLENARLVLVGLPTDRWSAGLLNRYDGVYDWLGHLPASELAAVYRDCDIFVLPSLAEGGCNVTFEALASGLPCVLSASASAVVRDGVEGFVLPAPGVEALKEAIARLYRDQELRRRMGEAARRRAESFTWADFRRRQVLLYRHASEHPVPGSWLDLTER